VRAVRALCALAVLLLAFVGTVSPPAFAKEYGALYYLAPDSVDLAILLAPPPVEDSPMQLYDSRKIAEVLTERTPADMAQADADRHRNIFVFTEILGPNFVAAKVPLTAAMFAHVNADTEILIDQAKAKIARHRPPGAKQTHGSYPSGHAAFAACTAILLSHMVPEKRAQLFARASIFAESRIIAGVHYPSDVEAGWVSGTVVAQMMLSQPKFQTDYFAARAEVRTALGLPPLGN
jgi:acid phosphatase (class A)